jgi:BolA family transcriptional regulator, general stress-responsive regulator
MLDLIETLLRAALHPTFLEVIDESHQHAGHAGAIPGQTTHVKVRIAAPALAGLSRVAAHRQINTALVPAIAAGLHALAIEVKID